MSALSAGTTARVDVAGAAAHSTVYVARGTPGPGPCPGVLAGVCLGITTPQLLFQLQADATGHASWSGTLPRQTPPSTLALQAASTGPASLSGVVTRQVLPSVEHVVIVGIDGLGGDFLTAPTTPRLDQLRAESIWTHQAQNALPTSSSTNWMSMVGGTSPDSHGVLSNSWQPGDSSPPPTMFAALRAARPGATMGALYDWGDLGRLLEPGVLDRSLSPGDETATTAAAITWMTTERPALTLVHLDHVDHAGHGTTWGSGAYDASVEEADALLGDIIDGLIQAGMWDRTALIVSSDHGGRGTSHGGDTTEERAIPLFVRVPGGPRGELTREARIWDVAPTALALLGVGIPDSWQGAPLVEAFGGGGAAPGGRLTVSPAADHDLIYNDAGSGAVVDMAVWRPRLPPGWVRLGHVAQANHGIPTTPGLLALDDDTLLARPVGYERIWSDAGSPSQADVTLYHPLPPSGFVCLGTVAVASHTTPPDLDEVRCVHESLTVPGDVRFLWTDTGSGATWDGSLWACDDGQGTHGGSFMTRRHASSPGSNRCRSLDPARIVSLP